MLSVPHRLPAQAAVSASLGARYTSTLVHDSVVNPIDLRPKLAPTVTVSAALPTRGRFVPDLSVDFSWSGLARHEAGTATDAGSAATLAFTVGLARALPAGLTARLGVGGLVYVGAEGGVFREGRGGIFPLGAAALRYAPPPLAHRRLALEVRYDLHRFITPALRTQGFLAARPVHRFAVAVRGSR